MPAFNSYIENLLARRGMGAGGLFGRNVGGGFADTSNRARVARRRTGKFTVGNAPTGRRNADPRESQYDFLYGGRQRPGGPGSSPLGTLTNQFPRTLGTYVPDLRVRRGIGGVQGQKQALERELYGQTFGIPSGKNRYPLGTTQADINAGLGTGRGLRTSPGLSADARGGERPGQLEGLLPGTNPDATGDISTAANRRTRVNAPLTAEDPTFGVPQTAIDKALRFSTQESALYLQEAYRNLANQGILGPAGMQNILEQVEGPENRLLQNLPIRLQEQLGFNQAQGADARRAQLKGLSGQLGRTGVQRPGIAAQIVSNASVPIRAEEANRAFGLEQNAYNLADRLALSQGQRRGDLLQQNIQSKAGGLAGLQGSAAGAAAIIGQRLFDPSNRLAEQYKFQSGLSEQDFQEALGLGRQGQGFTTTNMLRQNQINKNYAEFANRLQMQYRAWLANNGLDGSEDDPSYFERYLDYVKNNAEAMAKIMAGGG